MKKYRLLALVLTGVALVGFIIYYSMSLSKPDNSVDLVQASQTPATREPAPNVTDAVPQEQTVAATELVEPQASVKDFHYESEIIRSDEYEAPYALKTDSLGRILYFSLENGGTIHQGLYPDMNKITKPFENHDDSYWLVNWDVDENGYVYLVYHKFVQDQISEFVLEAYDENNNKVNSTQGSLEALKESAKFETVLSMFVDDFRVTDGGAYFIEGGMLAANSANTGEKLDGVLSQFMVSHIDINDDGYLYASVSTNGRKGTYEILKCDIFRDYEIVNRFKVNGDYFVSANPDGTVHLANKDAIYKLDWRTLETVLEFGTDTPFILGDYDVYMEDLNFFASSGDDFFVGTINRSNRSSRLYRLAFAPGAKTEAPKSRSITITAAYKQDFLEESVRKFELENNDFLVEWDVISHSEEDFRKSTELAGEKLAAKIMANDVGDIVATGGMGLPYLDILQTDAFVDLAKLLQEDPSYEDLNKNVLNAITLKGKVTGLPVGTIYTAHMYNKELGDKIGFELSDNMTWKGVLDKWLDISEKYPDICLFKTSQGANPDTNIFVPMLIAQMPSLINLEEKTVDLRQDWFTELVETYKSARDKGVLNKEVPYERHLTGTDDALLTDLLSLSESYGDLVAKLDLSAQSVMYIPAFSGEKDRNSIAYAYRMYSISNSSEKVEEAWMFLSWLIREESQTPRSLSSSPLNKKAEQMKRNSGYRAFNQLENRQFDLIQSSVDYLYDMSYYKQDLSDPLISFLDGKMSLEDALDDAESSILLRMSE
jgi:ABC-type glycerol-3-phosphate transport system substrate-binding protein